MTIVLFTLLYVPYVAHAAVTRPFWLDELFTFYIVTMPDWAGMLDLIQRGPDQNPPLFYALTRVITSVLGESEWAFRLPAMVGYWVFCVTLYLWVRLLGGVRAAALTALVTPVLTAAVYYASEARPYGLALGWLGIGLLGWQLTRHQNWQPVGIAGLSTGLCVALALHYLIILPSVPAVGHRGTAGVAAAAARRTAVDCPVFAAGRSGPPQLIPLPAGATAVLEDKSRMEGIG